MGESMETAIPATTRRTTRRQPRADTPIAWQVNQMSPSREAVELRAYELFVERGGQHGHDVDDWLRAELELAPAVES
jgi:hypothetical protein